jgi:hypothetical protein
LRSLARTEASANSARERRQYSWDTDVSRLIPRRSRAAGATVRIFRGAVGTVVRFEKASGYRTERSVILPERSAILQDAAGTVLADTSKPLNILSRKVN